MDKNDRITMPYMTLENIARESGGIYFGDEALLGECISGAVTDSRKVKEGFLFIPIRGERVDGHTFIPEVFRKGARAVLSEEKLENPAGPYILVESAQRAMQKLAAFYRRALEIKVVGITGSVGKTSTKEMISSVLEQKYRVLKTSGNLNNGIGLPLTIFEIRKEHQVAVLEMGISEFGEMHQLAEMAYPDVCVITNIGPCHLENLGDRDGVLRAKTETFEHLRPNAAVVLNGDDDKLCTKTGVGGRETIFYGLDAEKKRSVKGNFMAEKSVYATDVRSFGLDGTKATIHTPFGVFEADIFMPGEHNVYNALAATAVGLELGLSLEEIARGIAAARTIAGRTNVIETNSLTIIDDCYNANPVSMKASVEVLSNSKGRKIAVLGDMGELGRDERMLHREVGEAVAGSSVDVLFAAGSLAEEYALATAGSEVETHYCASVDELIPALEAFVKKGDTILVKASHFMNFSRVVDVIRAVGENG